MLTSISSVVKNMKTFPTNYSSILQRIDAVDPVRYGKTRNYINGAVSYLSPYISRGVISTRQVYEAFVKKGYSLYQMEKWVSELAWRDYFQQVWKHQGKGIFTDLKQPQPDVQFHHLPTALANATTGIHAIDEGLWQLQQTGYMHNHLRMYTASVICNIGRCHWRQPAEWFYYHLLDGDLASNHCSWQWVAGSFSSKKYYCNQENINKYTGSMQRGSFLDTSYDHLPDMPVPEALQTAANIKLQTVLPKMQPIELDASLPTLLYNSYNLDPQWRSQQRANRILLLEPSHFAQYPVNEKVLQFILDLSKNIPGIQVFTGELHDLYQQHNLSATSHSFYSKEHPAFTHYPGQKDARDWLAPQVQGYFPSFFNYWKKVSRHL